MKRLFFLAALFAATLSLSAQRKMQVWEGNLYTEYATSIVDSVTFLYSPVGTLKPVGVVHDTIIKEVHDTIYLKQCPDEDSDVLTGVFSVSADKQVRFTRGNLQCTLSATDTIWSFAEHQYDMIGTDNVSGDKLTNKIDLFGWSGSTGSAKWGIGTFTGYSYNTGDFVDWGRNIGDGLFFTLAQEEWNYLLNVRTNACYKRGIACIQISESKYQGNRIKN